MTTSVAGSVSALATGPWGLIFTLIGLAAVLTVAGLVLMVRSRRTPGGDR